MAAAIVGERVLRNQAAPDAADAEVPWPPRGYFHCRICDRWTLVYPNNGEKVSRWYAEMHVKGRDLERKIYRCDNDETFTLTAMTEHRSGA